MKRDDFVLYTKISLELLAQFAESKLKTELSRDILFSWNKVDFDQAIALRPKDTIDTIVDRVYMEEDKIFPCVDLVVDEIVPFRKMLVYGRVAGFEPREFRAGWGGRPGPFVFAINSNLKY